MRLSSGGTGDHIGSWWGLETSYYEAIGDMGLDTRGTDRGGRPADHDGGAGDCETGGNRDQYSAL